jgi:integrase/recombinase XerD
MQRIGKECGIEDCRPHKLRDSFAVRKLIAGVSLDEVSRLPGHTSVKMTEQAYAAWVPARTRRLEGIVADSLEPASRDSATAD